MSELSTSSDLLRTDIAFGGSDDEIENSSAKSWSEAYASPEISCFPEKVVFAPLYLNSIAHQKILVTNSGITVEHLKLQLEGDNAFEIRSNDITIPPGESIPFMVSFHPLHEKNYTAVLFLEGKSKITINVSGQCLPPPIEITEQSAPLWDIVSTRSSSFPVTVSNHSATNRMTVSLSTNCECFIVREDQIEIAPNSFKDVLIDYDPSKPCATAPKLICKCDSVNQVIVRTFNVIDPRNCVYMDFGVVAVGNIAKRSMRFDKQEKIPILEKPFSASPATHQNAFHFFFHPTEPGDYKETAKFMDLDVKLTGQAIKLPFVIHPENMLIENTSAEQIRLEFEVSPPTLSVVPCAIEISPRATSFVIIHRAKTLKGTVIPMLAVTYIMSNGKRVLSRFELPPSTENTQTGKEISASFQEQNSVDSDSADDEESCTGSQIKVLSPRERSWRQKSSMIRGKPLLLAAHPSFLGFFQMDTSMTSTFVVTGCDEFELQGPKWLSFPSDIEVDAQISVKCHSLPSVVTGSAIKIESQGSAPLLIPVIGYKGKSEMSCMTRIPLTWAMDDHYVVQMEIRNVGTRTGFVVLTAADGCKYNVRVHPVAAVIRPNSKEVFEFIVDSPQRCGLHVPVTLYSGDEILRQIKAKLNPDDFFAEVMKSVKVRDETAPFESYLQHIEPKEFTREFKKMLTVKNIEMYSPERTLSTRLAVSPPKLEFFDDETNTLSIINMSSDSMAVQLFASENYVILKPSNAVLKPYSELRVSVQMIGRVATTIEIRSEDGIITVPVQMVRDAAEQPLKKLNKRYFKIDQKIIDFGICEVGGTRKLNAIMTNQCDSIINVRVRSTSRSWKVNTPIFNVPSSIRLGRFNKTAFMIEFNPPFELDFQEEFVVEYKDQVSTFKVIGKAVGKTKGTYVGTDSQSLEFPLCQVGRMKRGRLRVNNHTPQRANITARTDYPFICPISSFTVEPNCYVLFPVHFSPKLPGEFSAVLRFNSDVSPNFAVQLRGTAFVET